MWMVSSIGMCPEGWSDVAVLAVASYESRDKVPVQRSAMMTKQQGILPNTLSELLPCSILPDIQ